MMENVFRKAPPIKFPNLQVFLPIIICLQKESTRCWEYSLWGANSVEQLEHKTCEKNDTTLAGKFRLARTAPCHVISLVTKVLFGIGFNMSRLTVAQRKELLDIYARTGSNPERQRG